MNIKKISAIVGSIAVIIGSSLPLIDMYLDKKMLDANKEFLQSNDIKLFLFDYQVKKEVEYAEKNSERVPFRELTAIEMKVRDDEVHKEIGKMQRYYIILPSTLDSILNLIDKNHKECINNRRGTTTLRGI